MNGILRRYSTTQPHAVINDGVSNYTYDVSGNMTSGAGRSIVYDAENRPTVIVKESAPIKLSYLTAIGGKISLTFPNKFLQFLRSRQVLRSTKAITTTRFYYDGDGKRVMKTAAEGSVSLTTFYVDDLYEKDIKATGSSERLYISINGQRVAMEENGQKSFFLNDHLGGTNVVTNSSGQSVEYTDYKPYGDIKSDIGTLKVTKKFTGKELDASTGLYDYGARMYDPKLGRFISADTIKPDLTDPQQLNRYSYCLNNPVKYVDPTGHMAEPLDMPLVVTSPQ